MIEKDMRYMQRAIELAYLGKGTVSPNPMVGCVIVYADSIIGEGWHQKAGEPHAEVRAIQSVKEEHKVLLEESTVYVTLEPCAHYGRTPPCAELLVKSKVKRVVIGCTDPNPLVAGKGIEILQNNGVELSVNCLKEECEAVNEQFFFSITHKIPYIKLKWAETADGFVARENYDSKWISNSQARQLVHKWRSEYDAILVGKNTALYDNPQLNVRHWGGKNPVRIIIDHGLNLSSNLKLMDGTILTYIYNLEKNEEVGSTHFVKLGAENFYHELLSDLDSRGVRSLFIEGGAKTLQEFIDRGLWNKASVFIGATSFESGIKSPKLVNHSLIGQKHIEDNILIEFENNK